MSTTTTRTIALAAFSFACSAVDAFAPTKHSAVITRASAQKPAFVLGAGAFDYTADLVSKGRLVVTFEPDPDPDDPVPVEPLPEVFPGIGLPTGEVEPPRIENTFTNAQVEKYVAEAAEKFFSPAILGRPKSDEDSLKVAQDLLIKVNKLGTRFDSADYKFFGNGDHAKNLVLLLKNNPFMAPALTELPDGNGYELKTFDPTGKDTDFTLYRQIMSTLNGVGHRVNFQFDSKMEKCTAFEMYDDVTASKREDVDMQTAASAALYGLFFFASCIHATIHVLHYLYTAAFQVASKDFPEMNQWANDYAKNIPAKYVQVQEILLPQDPLNQLAVITGGSGLGSSLAVKFILKAMLQGWGMRPSAEGFYFDNLMNISKKKIEKDGVILKEFMKHFDLIEPFADKARRALSRIDSTKFNAAEEELGAYLKRCGEFTSNLSRVDEWIEVMSVTGAMHGGTLGYTRLLAMPEVLRWRNFVNANWDFPDVFLLNAGLGTIIGVEDGRHVMTDSEGPYDDQLQDVLKYYDSTTTRFKKLYQEKIMKDCDFNDFGWILSDFCLDDFDGKQLTIATYV